MTGPARLDKIKPGATRQTAAVVDLVGVVPGEYTGTVNIHCLTCPPTCSQTATTLEVRLVAVGGASTAGTPPPGETPSPEGAPSSDTPRSPSGSSGDTGGRSSAGDSPIVPETDDRDRKIADENCVLSKSIEQVYSRGQNNNDQMKEQAERSGTGVLQYETAQMKLQWSLESACECRDRGEGDPQGAGSRVCTGDVNVALEFRVTHLDPKFGPDLVGIERNDTMIRARAMVPVEPPTAENRTREIAHDGTGPPNPRSGDPRPSVRMHLDDRYRLPEGEIPFTVEGDGYVAHSSTKISCAPGEHSVRFLMVDNDKLGRSRASMRSHTIDKELQIVADANITLAQDACSLEVEKMESFLVEIRKNYTFEPVAYKNQKGQLVQGDPRKELPRAELEVGRKSHSTHSPLRLIDPDGGPNGEPFPKREEGVPPEEKK